MGRRLVGLLGMCLLMTGCQKLSQKKPDPTKGVVTGIVLCADTGKPARFAKVALTGVPKKDAQGEGGQVLPETESAITDLDGRFRMEAVEPGRYYAYATLEGYLDPERGIDIKKVVAAQDDNAMAIEAIKQWKEHMVEVAVGVHRVAEVSLSIERGAEIQGMVSFDDGSPAIGMHFQLSRRKASGEAADVGISIFSQWSLDTVSDGHGRYSVTNLPAGEYVVCTLMPADTQDTAARVCLGDTFRRKNAKTVKVGAGEIAGGADIVIPLNGLHRIGGTITVLADGHVPGGATVHLLYADDREEIRKVAMLEDGSFVFEYVPEDKYLVRVTEAKDLPARPDARPHLYADREIPVMVKDDVEDLRVDLKELATPQTAP